MTSHKRKRVTELRSETVQEHDEPIHRVIGCHDNSCRDNWDDRSSIVMTTVMTTVSQQHGMTIPAELAALVN